MSNSDSNISKLRDFAAVPQRYSSDRRIALRHAKVLGAVCKSVDKRSGIALVSQKKIGERSGRHRNKVGPILKDLEAWGYIEIIRRGRHTSGPRKGKFRTNHYRIFYEPKPIDLDTNGGCAAPAPPDGSSLMQPREGADSDLSNSDISFFSEELSEGCGLKPRPRSNAVGQARKEPSNESTVARHLAAEREAWSFDNDLGLADATGVQLSSIRKLSRAQGIATRGMKPIEKALLDIRLRAQTGALQGDEQVHALKRLYEELAAQREEEKPTGSS